MFCVCVVYIRYNSYWVNTHTYNPLRTFHHTEPPRTTMLKKEQAMPFRTTGYHRDVGMWGNGITCCFDSHLVFIFYWSMLKRRTKRYYVEAGSSCSKTKQNRNLSLPVFNYSIICDYDSRPFQSTQQCASDELESILSALGDMEVPLVLDTSF